MKKLLTFIFLLFSFLAFSQNNGINFQGVGRNLSGAVLATQKISLRLSVIQGSETGTVEYLESKEVTTNAQGIFSIVIGDGTQITKTGNFSDINWKLSPKFLKVEMDPSGASNFVTMGTTRLQSVPFAFYANGVNADNVEGVLSASKGGTGVASISALKTALGIDLINNTSDLAKPISTATQEALDTKISTATFSPTVAGKANVADLALKAPIDSPTFTGTVSGITKAMVGLSNVVNTSDLAKPISTATQEALDMKVSTATFSPTVAGKANVADLALKAPIDSPTFTGTVSGITKAMVGLSNVENTTDLAKPISVLTQMALDTKISIATFSSTVAKYEIIANKSTAIDLGGTTPSDILFPTQKAVKDYVSANAGSGGVADGGITNIKLADGAVTYAKFQTIPTNSILGNTSSSTTSVQAIATTGSDNVVLSTSPMIISPILITPHIGIATADSINSIAINGISFKGSPSITIKGTTTIEGSNSGDNATNTKYEGLLTYGAVDLITDQAIDGKKMFLNNIIMANLLGADSITPTTINFANGSKIGDIQNINGDDPDDAGSIDLFAPYGAKRVQINYGDSNYMRLSQNSAGIGIGNMHWGFNKDGDTILPNNLFTKGILGLGWGFINSENTEFDTTRIYSKFDTTRILSPTNFQIAVLKGNFDPNSSNTFNNWHFNNNGTTELPGDLNFTDNHAINFTSTGTSTPITNTGITSTGPYLKLATRAASEDELNKEVYRGVELNYADISRLTVDYDGIIFKTTDYQNPNSFNWNFNNNGTTDLPGDLNFTDNHAINFKTGSSSLTTNSSITSTGPYLNIHTGCSSIGDQSEILLDVEDGSEVRIKTDEVLLSSFDISGDESSMSILKNSFLYRFYGSGSYVKAWHFNGLDASTTLPGALLLTGNIETAGTLTLGNTLFPNASGNPGHVLTINEYGAAVWQAPTGTGVSDNIDASTLSGTTLNATVTGSSLTSVGILSNATVNGKVIVGAAAEASSSAILEASSTTQGFLPPRMTIVQRIAIVSPEQGLMIYCTNCGTYGEPQYYNGNAWMSFAGTASSKNTPTINITVSTYTFTASTPQGPNSATNTGTGTTYTYTYVGTGSTSYASSATRPTNAGTYSVTASLSASGDGNYNAATASAAFTIV